MPFPRQALWLILLFWVSLFCVAYLLFSEALSPKTARATADNTGNGITVERSRDGHFYVRGTLNSTPVTFLVDTGATTIAVGQETAQRAGLAGGAPVRLETAGGVVDGQMLSNVTIVAGGIRVDGLRVAVSPAMKRDQALLGQNFLRHVLVLQSDNSLTLQVRGSP